MLVKLHNIENSRANSPDLPIKNKNRWNICCAIGLISSKLFHLLTMFGNNEKRELLMKIFTAVIEKCSDTGLYVGSVPGFPGAHSQAETLDELNKNLKEVIEMLLEDGDPEIEGKFIGTQNVMVA